MRGIEKLLTSILFGLMVTLISGMFPSPLSYVLLGVALRGLPFAWMSQVIYPNAPIKVEYDGFLLDAVFWASVFYICYYRICKRRQVSPKLKSWSLHEHTHLSKGRFKIGQTICNSESTSTTSRPESKARYFFRITIQL